MKIGLKIETKQLINMYFISLDGKTIKGPHSMSDAMTLVRTTFGKGTVIQDTFTSYDLMSGVSKELIYNQGRTSSRFWMGKNLSKADLKKKADNFGTLK